MRAADQFNTVLVKKCENKVTCITYLKKLTQIFCCKCKGNALLYSLYEKSNLIM